MDFVVVLMVCDHIAPSLQDDSSLILFKMKRTTEMKKVMQVYCDRQGLQMNSTRFEFDGAIIGPKQTPSQVSVYV